jgi:O-antigen/teichoic acid export membrane protein
VLCRKSMRMHLLFTIGVAVFFTCEAPAIVRVVLGPAYSEAARGLAILMWALPGSYMADTLLFLLTAQRRQGLATWAVGITAAVNIGLNFVLVQRFSFVGASVATVASEWLSFALLFAMFRRATVVPNVSGVVWRPVVAGVLLGAGLAMTAPWRTHGLVGLAAAALTTAVVYPALLIACGAIGREDFELVRAILPVRHATDVAK